MDTEISFEVLSRPDCKEGCRHNKAGRSKAGRRGNVLDWTRGVRGWDGRGEIKGIGKQLGSLASSGQGSDQQMNLRTGQSEDACSRDGEHRLKGLFNKGLIILHHPHTKLIYLLRGSFQAKAEANLECYPQTFVLSHQLQGTS